MKNTCSNLMCLLILSVGFCIFELSIIAKVPLTPGGVQTARQEIIGGIAVIDRLRNAGMLSSQDVYKQLAQIRTRIGTMPGMQRYFPEWVKKFEEKFQKFRSIVFGTKTKSGIDTSTSLIAQEMTDSQAERYVQDILEKSTTLTKDRKIFDQFGHTYQSPTDWWEKKKDANDQATLSKIVAVHHGTVSMIDDRSKQWNTGENLKEIQDFVAQHESQKTVSGQDIANEFKFWLLFHLIEKKPAQLDESPLSVQGKATLVKIAFNLFTQAFNIRKLDVLQTEVLQIHKEVAQKIGKPKLSQNPAAFSNHINSNKSKLETKFPKLMNRLKELKKEYEKISKEANKGLTQLTQHGYASTNSSDQKQDFKSDRKKRNSSILRRILISALVAAAIGVTTLGAYKVYKKYEEQGEEKSIIKASNEVMKESKEGIEKKAGAAKEKIIQTFNFLKSFFYTKENL